MKSPHAPVQPTLTDAPDPSAATVAFFVTGGASDELPGCPVNGPPVDDAGAPTSPDGSVMTESNGASV